MPACLPLVQTLVATKSLAFTRSSSASWPDTDSAEPYIGELSITRPPRSTSAFSASRACAVSAASPATSNACHVPSPTAGIVSPVFGMGRCNRSAARAAGMLPPSVSAAASLSQARRETPVLGLPGVFIVWNDRILTVLFRRGTRPNRGDRCRGRAERVLGAAPAGKRTVLRSSRRSAGRVGEMHPNFIPSSSGLRPMEGELPVAPSGHLDGTAQGLAVRFCGNRVLPGGELHQHDGSVGNRA